jgi:hypothetical protein
MLQMSLPLEVAWSSSRVLCVLLCVLFALLDWRAAEPLRKRRRSAGPGRRRADGRKPKACASFTSSRASSGSIGRAAAWCQRRGRAGRPGGQPATRACPCPCRACGDGLTDKATSKPEPGVALPPPLFWARGAYFPAEKSAEVRGVRCGRCRFAERKAAPARLAPCLGWLVGCLGGSSEKQQRQGGSGQLHRTHPCIWGLGWTGGQRTEMCVPVQCVRAISTSYESTTTVAAAAGAAARQASRFCVWCAL